MEHCWNDEDRGKKKPVSQCYSVHKKIPHSLILDQNWGSMVRGQQLSSEPQHGQITALTIYYLQEDTERAEILPALSKTLQTFG